VQRDARFFLDVLRVPTTETTHISAHSLFIREIFIVIRLRAFYEKFTSLYKSGGAGGAGLCYS
jgi:hypothetical protein